MNKIDIVRIPEIENKQDGIYKIYALSIDDISLAINGLKEIKQNAQSQYKKLVVTLRMIANNKKGTINDLSRIVPDRKHKEIYELKAKRKNARLFAFYDESGPDSKLIICTNTYWKTRDNKFDRSQQARQFEIAEEMRQLYLKNKGEKENE